jgi:hypothetical protein
MKSNITVLTLILLSPLIAYSQVILGEMRLEPVPEGQGIFYIVRNEEVAILIVHSKIPVMSFDCNMGIIRVDNPDPGEYR